MRQWFHRYQATFWGMAAIVVLLVAIHGVDYSNALRVYDNSINSCERGKKDREANIRGWSAAMEARLKSAANAPTKTQAAVDLAAAKTYASIIADLSSRIRPCDELITNKPRFIPS